MMRIEEESLVMKYISIKNYGRSNLSNSVAMEKELVLWLKRVIAKGSSVVVGW